MIWPFPEFINATLALGLERIFGYPPALQATIGHPAEWLGNLLKRFEEQIYSPSASPLQQRLRGIICLSLLILASGLPAVLIANSLAQYAQGWVIESILATTFLAQKSLYQHVSAVMQGLQQGLPQGRAAVSQIVGRDTTHLDDSDVCRAALESLSENTSDGVVAPLFWYALLGLPGIVVYKTINTADSMIGHHSERYEYFGWAAALLDDVVNFLPARLTGLLFALAAGFTSSADRTRAFSAMKHYAHLHQSPNAGFPESAMAGALNLRFGGPRHYHGHLLNLPWAGDGRTELNLSDITRGLALYGRTLSLLFALSFAIALLV